MSYHNGPRIVTDGLVLCLDAGNRKSYPGSGNTWYDLSGKNNHATLFNGVGYDNENGGSLVFNGINNYGTFPSPIESNSPQTYEVFVKGTISTNAADETSYILHNNVISFYVNAAYFAIICTKLNTLNVEAAGSFLGANWTSMKTGEIFSNIISNHIVLTWNNSTQTIYNNGIPKKTTTQSTVPANFDTLTSFGSSRRASGYRPFLGNIYLIKAYNRSLSPKEVQQNYNAIKGRYGL